MTICKKIKNTCNICGYNDCQHEEGKEYPIQPGNSRPSGDCNICGLGPCTCSSKKDETYL